MAMHLNEDFQYDRAVAIEFILDGYLEGMSVRDLEVYFRETYGNLLDGYSDAQIQSKLSEFGITN